VLRISVTCLQRHSAAHSGAALGMVPTLPQPQSPFGEKVHPGERALDLWKSLAAVISPQAPV